MSYRVIGILHAKFDAEQVTERFRKREFVMLVDPDSRWPQYVKFELTGKRCEALDAFEVDDELDLEFVLKGREWTSRNGDVRYFNGLQAVEISRVSSSPGPPRSEEEPPPPDDPPPEYDDDIPF